MKNLFLAVALLTGAAAWGQNRLTPPVPPPGDVSLPLDEYNRLLELAGKTPKHAEPAPLPYVLKQADLKFRVADETVMGTVRLQGETFRKGETKVALTSGMTILDLKQDGKALPFEHEAGIETA